MILQADSWTNTTWPEESPESSGRISAGCSGIEAHVTLEISIDKGSVARKYGQTIPISQSTFSSGLLSAMK
jgi:hypothetical protein